MAKIIKILKKCIILVVIISVFVANMPTFNTYAEDRVAYVKATGVNVRSGGGTSYNVLFQVSSGDNVIIKSETKDQTGKTWYKIDYNGKIGFIRSDFIYFPKQYIYDENFEYSLSRQGFPEDYKVYLRVLHAQYPNWVFEAFNTNMDFEYAVSMEDEGTRTLVTKGAISSYKSTEEGKYDWTTSTWPTFDGKAWVCASKEVIRYYMDPRNFLIDPYVFQFEKQTFDESIHTLDGVKEMVKGTFLENAINTAGIISTGGGNQYGSNIGPGQFVPSFNPAIIPNSPTSNFNNQMPTIISPNDMQDNVDQYGNVIPILESDDEMINFASTIYAPGVNINTMPDGYEESSFNFTYLPSGTYTCADIIYDACRQVRINPYVVVSLILQEQGKDGKSDIISGNKSGYKGFYNYGNISAFASGDKSVIENGLIYAMTEGSYNRPWNSKEKALYGVIDYYANSFINRGQDTIYLKKWNVQGSNTFKHQYMTNVLGAASEGQILASAYDENMKNMKHIMKIPIYNNLPANRCEKPTKDGSPNNKLKDLTVSGYTLTPTFNKDINAYTLIVPENTNKIKVSATKFDSKANVSGSGNVTLTTAITNVVVRVVAENKDIREYNIMVFKPNALNEQNIINATNNAIVLEEQKLIIPSINDNTNINIPADALVPSPPISNSYNAVNGNGPSSIIYSTFN